MANILRKNVSPTVARLALVAYGAIMAILHDFLGRPAVYAVAMAAVVCLYVVAAFISQNESPRDGAR